MAKTTSIKEWRSQSAPTKVELPSGNVALLRKVSILDLATSGSIPSTLIVKASAIAKGKRDWSKILDNPDDMREMMGMLKPIVIAAFVDPKVGEEPSDDQLGVDEIDPEDKLAVFQWCNQGANALRSFRGESKEGVEPAQPGEGVQPEAEPDPEGTG